MLVAITFGNIACGRITWECASSSFCPVLPETVNFRLAVELTNEPRSVDLLEKRSGESDGLPKELVMGAVVLQVANIGRAQSYAI